MYVQLSILFFQKSWKLICKEDLSVGMQKEGGLGEGIFVCLLIFVNGMMAEFRNFLIFKEEIFSQNSEWLPQVSKFRTFF